MKLPKYMDNLLKRRAKLAADLMDIDYQVTEFIQKHEIEVEPYDYCTGCEMYVNPYSSAERVRQAILSK